ncbi:hypothetical protein ACH4NF_32455 [Streptomyces sp. NPDC017248]|uniref:hypothetical protein n=1 Tax=unclassified Streptomyces TaxID=2593676 RepID=UPI003798B7C3
MGQRGTAERSGGSAERGAGGAAAAGEEASAVPDVRRRIPRTDALLREPGLRDAADRLGPERVKAAVRQAQQQAREGMLRPEQVTDAALTLLPRTASGLHPVINATGVLLHTNLGRAPLSAAARRAVQEAAGPTDVELDLTTGARARRGRTALAALRAPGPACMSASAGRNRSSVSTRSQPGGSSAWRA